jgi:hypothetical protein
MRYVSFLEILRLVIVELSQLSKYSQTRAGRSRQGSPSWPPKAIPSHPSCQLISAYLQLYLAFWTLEAFTYNMRSIVIVVRAKVQSIVLGVQGTVGLDVIPCPSIAMLSLSTACLWWIWGLNGTELQRLVLPKAINQSLFLARS